MYLFLRSVFNGSLIDFFRTSLSLSRQSPLLEEQDKGLPSRSSQSGLCPLIHNHGAM